MGETMQYKYKTLTYSNFEAFDFNFVRFCTIYIFGDMVYKYF